ncbi:hypothetical protein GCM10022226_79700 [Sphaerisporangium flaviroseum]|uniref:Uncharacterized protein n=1 Tax=Sphaerisporangium flaviroseum TaxID=509199 RepID=A0ABP7JGK3_9ACTN
MSSTPKSPKSLVHELFQAVTKLSSAVIGKPINPGPVVDPRHGWKNATDPGRRRR